MPFSSSTKNPHIKPNHKDAVQVLDPSLRLHHKVFSIFILLHQIIVHEVNQHSSSTLPIISILIDTILVLRLHPSPQMAYPINPNARAQSTYHGPSHQPSTLAAATFPITTLTPHSSASPIIIDGYIPIHPHHLYPTLFPPPTNDLPLHPSPSTPLAPLYQAAARAAQQWTAHLQAWSAATSDALSRPPPPPHRACGAETLHPHHFFPWLFDEPTVYFPLYVCDDEPLAGVYERALRAAEGWVGLRREWAVVEENGRQGRGEEERGWEGVEDSAEGDALWEQGRLDEEREREREHKVLEEELGREWKRLDEEAGGEGV
ncbi:hypothetical protein MMC15_000982 [Xylographa vitiligo]|nr:hypothetical protein [Xylographa vitiligo]